MRVRPFLVVLFASLFAVPAFAWDLAVVTGFNYSHPSLNPDPPNSGQVSTKKAVDFGALLTVPISGDYVFGTGLIRHTRDTVLDDTIASTEERYSGWLIPLTFRFMRAEFLGFGFGPYVNLINPRTKTTTTYRSAAGTASSDATDPNRKTFEVGFLANLRIAVPVYHDAKIVFDGSYLFGVTDLNKIAIEEDKTQDLLFLIGLQIPLGGGDTSPAGAPPRSETALAPPIEESTLSNPTPKPTPSPKSDSKKKKKEKRK